MVQPAFDIRKQNSATMPENCQLLIEISGQAFNYIVFTRSPDQLFLLRQYRIYTTSDKTTRDVLEEIVSGDPVLQQYAHKAIVVYNFAEANIFPSSVFDASIKVPASRLVHGDTENHFVFDEPVRDHDLHIVYLIHKDLHSLFREKFSGSQYWHLYTMILLSSAQRGINEPTYARVIFYNDKFVTAVFKDEKLLLLQTYNYQTPEDVAYQLLLMCKQFGIGQQELALYISGLIDTQSALYTELMKYFQVVNFEGVPSSYGTNGILDEFPPHYFSPLLKMSLCV